MSQEQLNRMLSIIRQEPIDYYKLLGIERGNFTLDDLSRCKKKYNKVLHPDISEHEVSPELVKKYEEVLKAVNAGLADLKKQIIGPEYNWNSNPAPEPDPTPSPESEPKTEEENKSVRYSKLWSIFGGVPFAENIEYQGYSDDFLGLIKEIGNLERFYKNTAKKYGEETADAVFHKYICEESIAGFTRDPQTRDRTAIEGLDRSSIIKMLLQHALMNYIVGNKVSGKVINDPNFNNKNKKILLFFSSINFYEFTPEKLLEIIYSDEELVVSLLGNLNFEYSMPGSEVFQCYKTEVSRNPELSTFMNKLNTFCIKNPELEKVKYTYKKKERASIPFETIMERTMQTEEVLHSVYVLDDAGIRTNNKYRNGNLYKEALVKYLKTGSVNSFSRNPKTGRRDELEKISRTDLIKIGIAHSFMNYIIGDKVDGEVLNNPILGIKGEIYNCINNLDLNGMTSPEVFIQEIIKDEDLAMSLIQNIDYRYLDKNSKISNSYINIILSSGKSNKEKEILEFMKRIDAYISTVREIPFSDNNGYERGWRF